MRIRLVLTFAVLSSILCFTYGQSPQRFGHSSITLQNGSIVIFGGHDFVTIDHPGKEFVGLKNDMWILDLDLTGNKWRPINVAEGSHMPLPRMQHTAIYKYANNTEFMVIYGGTIFLRYSLLTSNVFKCCGREDIWEFNFSNLTWSPIVPHLSPCNAGMGSKVGYVLLVSVLMVLFMC